VGIFHESVANRVLDDLVAATRPKKARLTADFNVRGGIHTVVETSYRW
jgi:7-cyano-7-deazaguanine reductase